MKIYFGRQNQSFYVLMGCLSILLYFVDRQLLMVEKRCFRATFKKRQVLDRFQDSSKTGSGINFIPTFLGPAFWHAFLRTQYKRRSIF
jgi:hypothetical protein